MSYCKSRNNNRLSNQDDLRRFARVRQSAALRDDAFERWRASRVGVIGSGVIGSRLAPELVRSGVCRCVIYDNEAVSEENLGTQCYTISDVPKADALCDYCNSIRADVAESRAIDIRQAGIGELAKLDAFVDSTDDPNLQWYLAEVSNGLGIPMMRIAVDGSGERELGRIQVSHGGKGHACRLCSKSPAELTVALPRTPCPHVRSAGSTPTIAGNGIAMNVAGIGLIQLQRLLGGKSEDQVLNRQIIIDLDHFQIFSILERRCDKCISGHVTWDLIPAEADAAEVAFGELFDIVARITGSSVDVLEPYNHALCLAARCECGEVSDALGARWSTPPYCIKCRRAMAWEIHN
ncbi:MAG: ThiF family adenylyltransferase, partial [Thermoguttaceae bacterium]